MGKGSEHIAQQFSDHRMVDCSWPTKENELGQFKGGNADYGEGCCHQVLQTQNLVGLFIPTRAESRIIQWEDAAR